MIVTLIIFIFFLLINNRGIVLTYFRVLDNSNSTIFQNNLDGYPSCLGLLTNFLSYDYLWIILFLFLCLKALHFALHGHLFPPVDSNIADSWQSFLAISFISLLPQSQDMSYLGPSLAEWTPSLIRIRKNVFNMCFVSLNDNIMKTKR